MSLMQKTAICSILFSTQLLIGDSGIAKPQPADEQSHFHAIVASGYAWSMDADIDGLKNNAWALSLEGYKSSLGNSPFIMLGFGYRFLKIADADFGYTLYDTFHYQKNQTDLFGDKRTRFFDLDHQSALFNLSILPYTINLSSIEMTPFIGMGIGVGTSQVSHFQTVFYDPIEGVGLTTSIANPHIRNAFAWQGMGGIQIRPRSSMLSLDIAYRYYNGGTFESSSSIVGYNGLDDGELLKIKPLSSRFQTNQLYFAINFCI